MDDDSTTYKAKCEKVRKLFALAKNNPNKEEGKSAHSLACDLMKEYELSMEDIMISIPPSDPPPVTDTNHTTSVPDPISPPPKKKRSVVKWIGSLITLILVRACIYEMSQNSATEHTVTYTAPTHQYVTQPIPTYQYTPQPTSTHQDTHTLTTTPQLKQTKKTPVTAQSPITNCNARCVYSKGYDGQWNYDEVSGRTTCVPLASKCKTAVDAQAPDLGY